MDSAKVQTTTWIRFKVEVEDGDGDFVKATSHSTISDIPMRPFREDQKHQHRFTR